MYQGKIRNEKFFFLIIYNRAEKRKIKKKVKFRTDSIPQRDDLVFFNENTNLFLNCPDKI